MWQILVTVLAVCWLSTLVGTVILLQAKEEQILRLAKFAQGQQTEIERLQAAVREACDHISNMHRQGFVTLPKDDAFDTYTITPEFEADIEAARRGEDGSLREELRRSLYE